jgi:hypothetical protein
MGDFDFLTAVYFDTPKDKRYWLKKILVQTQQKSFGKPIDLNSKKKIKQKGYFTKIMR